MSAEPPAEMLPTRIAWFAPWRWFPHWQPWKRWTLIAGVLLVGYVLSPIAVIPVLDRNMTVTGPPGPVVQALGVFYLPIGLVAEYIPPVRWFYDSSFESMESAINWWAGPAPDTAIAPPPAPPIPPPPPGP